MVDQGNARYNLAAIRKLLLAAFTAEDLHRFCLDRPVFQPIVHNFGPKYSLNEMVDEVIEYCRIHVLLDQLLAQVQQVNRAQYALFERQLQSASDETYQAAAPSRQQSPAEAHRLAPQPVSAAPRSSSLPAWLWPAVGGAAVVLVIVGIIIATLGGGKGGKETPTDTPRPTVTLTEAPEPMMPVTKEPSAAVPPAVADAGEPWTRFADAMVMVYVPAGEFLMGSTDADSYANDDEKPQHTVYLDAFWIDKTEVTNAQFRECVEAGACQAPASNGSSSRDSYYGDSSFDNYPVIYVNWNQAKAYCEWAGGRLPTEAEWEKAARGTDGRKCPWGNQDPDCDRANYGSDCVGETSQVGNYPSGASPYGALDMAGNVWEWVADSYGDGYYAISPSNNPKGPDSGGFKVLRGGSWVSSPDDVRAAHRDVYAPDDLYHDIGFRCSAGAGSPGE